MIGLWLAVTLILAACTPAPTSVATEVAEPEGMRIPSGPEARSRGPPAPARTRPTTRLTARLPCPRSLSLDPRAVRLGPV